MLYLIHKRATIENNYVAQKQLYHKNNSITPFPNRQIARFLKIVKQSKKTCF